jgi:methionyl-tRNA formyltransferase
MIEGTRQPRTRNGAGCRNVFLGTSHFAAAVLGRLAGSPHRPVLVVAPPDRPRGRGRKPDPPPVARSARELGVELLQTGDVNEVGARERISAARPDVVTLCAFGQLLKEPLLSDHLLLNAHPSLLPRWRGAAPIERAIMAGDAEAGVSVMRVTAGLDAGPVALQQRVPISPDDDYGSLVGRLAALAGGLLSEALELQAAGELRFRDQDDALSTYAEKITSEERRLDPSQPAGRLALTVRALTPHIGAHLELEGGEWLGVWEARAEEGELEPGRVAENGGELRLGCGVGVLKLLVIQSPGGRKMAVEDYLRGHELPARAL